MSGKRALVTGCCGFIGSNLTRSLLSAGWIVDGVDDLSGGELDLLEVPTDSLRVVPGPVLGIYQDQHEEKRSQKELLVITDDFASQHVLSRVAGGMYDVIFHLAANPRVEYSVKHPAATTENNLNKTIQLMTAAAKNVDRFVFASTSAAYGDTEEMPTSESIATSPKSPYAVQKLCVESFGKVFSDLYGLDFVALRFFNVYGPGQYGSSPYSTAISAWCDKIKANQSLRSDGDGEQTRDLVFVGDVCTALKLIASRSKDFGFDVFNVATGKSLSNNEIIAHLKSFFPNLSVKNAPERPGDVKHTLASVDKLYDAIGFRPETSFNEGLNKTLKWWNLV